MRLFSLFMLLGLLKNNRIQAQGETPQLKAISAKVATLYNHQQYDSIYALFSPDMQKALSAPKINEFFSGIYKSAGSITSHSYLKTTNGMASYRTVFERGLFEMLLAVNSANQISGLLLKPLKEAKAPARNKTLLVLPFTGSWTVVWGGDTKEQNYHVESEAQKGAFDLVVMKESPTKQTVKPMRTIMHSGSR